MIKNGLAHGWGILAALLVAGVASGSSGDQVAIWDLRDVEGPWLYSHPFALARDATLSFLAVGSGQEGEDELVCYGWILDCDTREPVWVQTGDNTTPGDRRPEIRTFDGRIDLPAGRYIAYYSAIGRHYPSHRSFELFGRKMFNIRTTSGFWYPWDALGDTSQLRFRVSAIDDGERTDLVLHYSGELDDPTTIRFAPLGDNAYESRAFRVTRRVEVDLTGLAEYDASNKTYADRAWLADAWTRRPVWEVDPDETEPGGGAAKNHHYDARVTLAPGEYILTAITDDSHAYNDWNEAAPHDPQMWGVTMKMADEDDRDAIEFVDDPEEQLAIARIDRVTNSSFVRQAFRLDRPTLVHVEGLGELDHSKERLVDYGWLERLPEKRIVWSMLRDPGENAGGHYKNRLVSTELKLEPGTYVLDYVTDDSHAYGSWNAAPPRDPARWGVGVYAAERDFDPDSARLVDVSEADPAIISLAPTGNSAHRRQVMTLKRPYELRIVALGEGIGGKMYDYGWIEDVSTGQVVWTMTYRNSRHAGGAKKNRIVEALVTLQPGRYRVHYETDDSHSFESWNEDPPDRPELWGISIYPADGPSFVRR